MSDILPSRGAAEPEHNLPCPQLFYPHELWRPFRQSFGSRLARLFIRNNHIQIVAIDDWLAPLSHSPAHNVARRPESDLPPPSHRAQVQPENAPKENQDFNFELCYK